MIEISLNDLQDRFKTMYDAVTDAARNAIENKMSQNIEDADEVIIPFDQTKVELNFEDPESGQSGSVIAMKVLSIPYTKFGSIKSQSNSQFTTQVNLMFLNPLMSAVSDAFETQKNEYCKLYAKFGSDKDSSFNLYIVFNGTVESESAYTYDLDMESVYFDDDNYPSAVERITTESLTITEHYKYAKEFLKDVSTNPKVVEYLNKNMMSALEKNDLDFFKTEDELYKVLKNKSNVSAGGNDGILKLIANQDKITPGILAWGKINNLLYLAILFGKKNRDRPTLYFPWFNKQTKTYGFQVVIKSGMMQSKEFSTDDEDAVTTDIEKQTGDTKPEVTDADVGSIGTPELFMANETDELVLQEQLSTEGAFLKVSIPDGIKNPNEMESYLKKAGIEKTIRIRMSELMSAGYKQINLADYKKKIQSGTAVDKEFKNDTYISYHGGKPDLKEKREFIYTDIAGSAVVIGLYNSISADPAKPPKGMLNHGVANANKGYRLRKVWLAVYNPRTDRIIHKPIAKSSKVFGVKIEGANISTEGFWFTGNDLGYSASPDKVNLNKNTYKITAKDRIVLNFPLYPDKDWIQLVAPLRVHGIQDNYKNLYYAFQKVSQDWDYYSFDDYETPTGKKALEPLLDKFNALVARKAYTDSEGKTYDGWLIFIPFWWVYQTLNFAALHTIRPSDAEDADFYPMELTDIYTCVYNSATHEIATPLIASDGVLRQIARRAPVNTIQSVLPGIFPSLKVVKGAQVQSVRYKSKAIDISSMKLPSDINGAFKLTLKTALEPNRDLTKPTALSTVSEDCKVDLDIAKSKLYEAIAHEGLIIPLVKLYRPVDNTLILGESNAKYSPSMESAFGNESKNIYPKDVIDRLQQNCNRIVDESGTIESITVEGGTSIRFIAKLWNKQ
jgi:hypothetical protein